MKRSKLPFFSINTDIVFIIQIVTTIISLVIVVVSIIFFSDRVMCGNDTRTIKQQEVKQILIKKRIKMRIHNLWKNVSALLVAGCICCTMPLCNNDEAPATMQVQH